MEVTSTGMYAGCAIGPHIRLALVVFWVTSLPPTLGLYLDFYANHPLEHNTPDATKGRAEHETLSWAVKIQHMSHRKSINRTHLDHIADQIADELRLKNYGQVGELAGHYLFVADSYHEALNGSLDWDMVGRIRSGTEDSLARHPLIEWFNQQTIRRRFKRSLVFNDPSYPNQWHLHNSKNVGMDINVTGIWAHNITGTGVTVAVIDDGLEWMNEDIADNYCAEGSWDLNSNDDNPAPEVRVKDGKQTQNRHGTRCAGEIAAVTNNVCGVGVAFNAKVSGIRLLDGPMTDSLEATAFNKFMYINDIYSCSWGPDDDGKTVDGPHTLAKAALQHGVTYGRRGRGSIFVVASGNGGKNGDNCNFDGYANSMYTVTIGAVDEKGQMPFYAEECASLFAVTFSSGSRPQRNIVTTDWTLGPGTGCTNTHTGTSAAAPLAAGMIGLMLEAKPCLSWRDVQHIIVYTASKIDEVKGDWSINAAGFHHSHKHGFGVLKAWRLVNAAKVWPSVPWLTSIISPTLKVHTVITNGGSGGFVAKYEVTNATAQANELSTLEHVLITITLSHSMRGKLTIELVCPSGTRSTIGATRKKDTSRDGLRNWTFSTVRCWGEEAVGTWQLIITDHSAVGRGVLEEWKLSLYGSNMKRTDIDERKIMIKESYGGEFLDTNLTEPCSFYWSTPLEEEPYLSIKTVKFLLLVSGFATLLALYYSLEQAFCTDEEKRKYAQKLAGEKEQEVASDDSENRQLLQEDIPLENLGPTNLQEVTVNGGQSSEVDCTVMLPPGCPDTGRGDVDERNGETAQSNVSNVQFHLSSTWSVVASDNSCIAMQPPVGGGASAPEGRANTPWGSYSSPVFPAVLNNSPSPWPPTTQASADTLLPSNSTLSQSCSTPFSATTVEQPIKLPSTHNVLPSGQQAVYSACLSSVPLVTPEQSVPLVHCKSTLSDQPIKLVDTSEPSTSHHDALAEGHLPQMPLQQQGKDVQNVSQIIPSTQPSNFQTGSIEQPTLLDDLSKGASDVFVEPITDRLHYPHSIEQTVLLANPTKGATDVCVGEPIIDKVHHSSAISSQTDNSNSSSQHYFVRQEEHPPTELKGESDGEQLTTGHMVAKSGDSTVECNLRRTPPFLSEKS